MIQDDSHTEGFKDDEYLELKATLLTIEGKYEEAKRIINQLIDRDPYAVSYWNLLANTQFKNGETKECVTSSEYALAINPNDPEAIYYKANGLYVLGNIEGALHCFERYCELMPSNANGEFLQGICLNDLNRFEEALDHLKKAEQLMENDGMCLFEPTNLYQELAVAYSHTNHPEEAMSYLGKMNNHNEKET